MSFWASTRILWASQPHLTMLLKKILKHRPKNKWALGYFLLLRKATAEKNHQVLNWKKPKNKTDSMPVRSVCNFACSNTTLIEYKFKFVICSRALNFDYFNLFYFVFFPMSDTSDKCCRYYFQSKKCPFGINIVFLSDAFTNQATTAGLKNIVFIISINKFELFGIDN